ncbi:arginine/serine-rich protein PNISR-like isoform X3 [Selaginella moellendorffii]|uniref:arginine/serine-rich protein PNISR-like isoform X3 n=1 Tax=Selaginella moellendorffii TaxID=88036 RepID=UPI000D1C6F3D|nr:arginine/serine-rich protein PNISR-like isoform X3 [Selaginella moellendorffii]|eukprot:XP_024516594.1 arginine/serine-rich protein PNISR-like isoform X3 [Selaginella moellendorffii]
MRRHRRRCRLHSSRRLRHGSRNWIVLSSSNNMASSGLTQAVDWAAKAKAWMSAKSAEGRMKAVALDPPPESLQQPNGAFSPHPHFLPRPPELQPRPAQVLHRLSSVDPSQHGFSGSPSGVVWSVTPTMPLPPSQTFHPIQQQPTFPRLHGVAYRPAFAFGASPAVPVVDPAQQKKAPVPSWLREELKKKVRTPSLGPVTDVTRKNTSEVLRPGIDSTPVSPGGSETEGDDEDDAESAATSVINQEIKRVLTDVLLKVTDGLFNEIAQEIFDEEEVKSHASEKRETDNIPAPSAAPARVVVAAGDGEEAEIDTNCAGNFLGLASYDSDDDQTEKNDKKSTSRDTEHAKVPNSENPVVADHLKTQEKSTGREQLLARDSERNKENEGDPKLKEKKSRKDRRTEHNLKGKRYERHTPRSRSRSRSFSPRRSRSRSPSRRRSDKRRRSRSRSPRHSQRLVLDIVQTLTSCVRVLEIHRVPSHGPLLLLVKLGDTSTRGQGHLDTGTVGDR